MSSLPCEDDTYFHLHFLYTYFCEFITDGVGGGVFHGKQAVLENWLPPFPKGIDFVTILSLFWVFFFEEGKQTHHDSL